MLVHSLEGLPRAGEVEPMTVTLAGREVRVVKVLQRYYLQPGHVADAPLPLFLEELARSAEGLKDLRFWRLSPR